VLKLTGKKRRQRRAASSSEFGLNEKASHLRGRGPPWGHEMMSLRCPRGTREDVQGQLAIGERVRTIIFGVVDAQVGTRAESMTW
jgi:hypothetical protein